MTWTFLFESNDWSFLFSAQWTKRLVLNHVPHYTRLQQLFGDRTLILAPNLAQIPILNNRFQFSHSNYLEYS